MYIFAMCVFVASMPCYNILPKLLGRCPNNISSQKKPIFFIFPGDGNTDIDTSYHHGNIRPIRVDILRFFSQNIKKF